MCVRSPEKLKRLPMAEEARETDLHFENPPLHEVVFGVQFQRPDGYRDLFAAGVWDLFKDRFPKVEEKSPLSPKFETFGSPRRAEVNLTLSTEVPEKRFWFLTSSEAELLQFQSDRLLHNWRKVEGADHPYPRFESMIVDFEQELRELNKWFNREGVGCLEINQCEVSYVNHISLSDKVGTNPSDWIKYVTFDCEPEAFTASFRRVVKGKNEQPVGRLMCETFSALDEGDESIIKLQLTFRGAPEGSSVDAALDALKLGRSEISRTFLSTTTKSAHSFWERTK